jgi:glycosyltransferase involved in cell wall biosynthesis
MKTFIVIPAYNEEKSIAKVIKDLKKGGYNDIVVVDDGSKDNTYSAAEKAGADVLRHFINRGQGAALKTGVDYALMQRADMIVTFDADGQHLVSEIKRMTQPIVKGEVDVTLGSRFLDGKTKLPLKKRMVLKGAVFFMWLMYGIKLSDAHNGFRALSRKAAQKIEIKADRMEHASEIVEEIHKRRMRFKEIPVTIKYTDYSVKKGQSVWNSLRIAAKMMRRKMAD